MAIRHVVKFGLVGAVILGFISVMFLKATIPAYIELSTPKELTIISGILNPYQSAPSSESNQLESNIDDISKEFLEHQKKSIQEDINIYFNGKTFEFKLDNNPRKFIITNFYIKNAIKGKLENGSMIDIGLSLTDPDWKQSWLPIKTIKVNDVLLYEDNSLDVGLVVICVLGTIMSLLLIIIAISLVVKFFKERTNNN